MHLAPIALLFALQVPGQSANFDRNEDVIYGRKFGTALTMDVFTPKEKKNGVGVIFCVSGGWFSGKAAINAMFFQELLNRGYVVFAVVHGSQPRFSIPEVLEDMNRAVRFIRHNAKTYNVDPDRLGISGGSAGGHLSLMQGVAAHEGNADSVDPVDRETAKVAAVACFFPPTDFLNYGEKGKEALGNNTLSGFAPPFDFVEQNPKTRTFDKITDPDKRREIGKRISPVYHVTEKSAPTLIIHGDADKLVPIQQAELIIEKLKAAKVPCDLVVKEKAGHGWPDLAKDIPKLADWFDKHLSKK